MDHLPRRPTTRPVVLALPEVLKLGQQPEHFMVHVSGTIHSFLYGIKQRWTAGPSEASWVIGDMKLLTSRRSCVRGEMSWLPRSGNFGVVTPLAQIKRSYGILLRRRPSGADSRTPMQRGKWKEEKAFKYCPRQRRSEINTMLRACGRIDAMRQLGLEHANPPPVGRWKRAQPMGTPLRQGAFAKKTTGNWCQTRWPPMQMDVALCRNQVVRLQVSTTPAVFQAKGIYRAGEFKGHGFDSITLIGPRHIPK